MEAFDGRQWTGIVLKKVLYGPRMPFNFLSVVSAFAKNYTQSADSEFSLFNDSDGVVIALAVRESKVWRVQFRVGSSNDFCLVSTSLRKWHERLAHQNIRYVKDALVRNKIKFTDG